MPKSRVFLWGCALLMGAVVSSGCALFLIGAGAAAGVGTVAYVRGELKTAADVPMEKAWKAVQTAMADLEFKVTDTSKDALEGTITARGAEDKKITVHLKAQSDKVTEIAIRVGTFGDENLSRKIYDKIKSHF